MESSSPGEYDSDELLTLGFRRHKVSPKVRKDRRTKNRVARKQRKMNRKRQK